MKVKILVSKSEYDNEVYYAEYPKMDLLAIGSTEKEAVKDLKKQIRVRLGRKKKKKTIKV